MRPIENWPILLVLLLLTHGAAAQIDRNAPDHRERTWYAPTDADWAKPVLIEWQRTWDDAVALARETGKPLLVAINMDGEIASEHYAGVRYRQPDIAALYEPYVSVIASVYRHNPRDFDDEGRRIECPRFGTVTCLEHIAIEPVLFEKFMDGRRIAPRHIGVELEPDGGERETYDIMLVYDTESVFEAVKSGWIDRPAPPPVVRGDRSLVERVASPDAQDRAAVEEAYAAGDASQREALLEAALAQGEDAPVELLRLAVFGLDDDLARRARAGLARTTSPAAVDVIDEALRAPLDDAERQALVASLERLGSVSSKAKRLAVVHQGLARRSSAVDVDAWTAALDGGASYAPASAEPARPDAASIARLEEQDAILRGGDGRAHLELAEAFLTAAYDAWSSDREYARLLFMDARETMRKAAALGERGWRVDACQSIADYYLGDVESARARAAAAVASGEAHAADGWNAMAVLAIFAQQRQEAISAAMRAGGEWPGAWLADVNAACSVLLRHPHGTLEQAEAYYDFLAWIGAHGQAASVLETAIARWTYASALHERLRARVLAERGAAGLEPAYEALAARLGDSPALAVHAAAATRVRAEFHRRRRETDAALAAYERAASHAARAMTDVDEADAAAHEAAMSHAGRARVAFEGGDLGLAVDELLAAFAVRPGSAATQDGLNLSAVDTSRAVLARLRADASAPPAEAGAPTTGDATDASSGSEAALAEERRTRLEAALGALDPSLLAMPAYERIDPAPGGAAAPP